jgi:tetratricopeptide (TPR) repeat protein
MRVVQGEFRPARDVKAAVPAALSGICRKAMALGPPDRYGSAKELAAEVERWLADEPVAAYREPWRQRLGRWGRRHRPLVAGLVVLLLTGLVGLGLGLWAVRAEQRRTAQERDQAEANLALAKQAVDECFLIAKEHPLLEREEMEAVRRRLLEKALPFYRNFRMQRPDDPGLKEELAGIAFRVGYITRQIGQDAEALAAYQEALRLYTALAEGHSEVAQYQANLAACHNNLGSVQSAMGDREAALGSFQQALTIQTTLAEQHPEVGENQADLAACHFNLGRLYAEAGDRKGALRSNQQALKIRASLAEKHPEVAKYQAELAHSHNNLGAWHRLMGDRQSARRSYEQALQVLVRLAEQHPEVAAYQVSLARTRANLGNLLAEEGKGQDGLALFAQAITSLEQVRRCRPEDSAARAYLRDAHANRARALNWLGRHPEAAADWQQALDLDDGRQQATFRIGLAGSWAHTAQHARAAAVAAEFDRVAAVGGGDCYNLGCVWALLLAAARKDVQLSTTDRDRLTEQYAAKAVGWLRRAQAAGYFQNPVRVAHLHKDSDLDPLRPRPEFQQFLAELQGGRKKGP